MYSEKEIVSGLKRGDDAVFKFFIEQHKSLVNHISFKLLGDIPEREELCQDAFLKVYAKIDSFQFKSKLSTWLGRIIYNLCLDHLKKNKPEIRDIDQGIGQNKVTDLSADKLLHQEDSLKHLKFLINSLPERYRLVLSLYHLDEKTYREIGEIMEMKEGTVKNCLFRARQKLKEKLLIYYKREEL